MVTGKIVPRPTATTGTGSVVIANTVCANDLPKWYKPSTGATSIAATSPGVGWYLYPYTRTYTVEQFQSDLTTRSLAPATYAVKLLTVTVDRLKRWHRPGSFRVT